uniref:Eukaryotic peptide chain release factor subunit 1 n=1 Tax=Chromera velia CCMP2878 TaxID=1169474 RepID=A0A0G4I5Q0_9ALVE|eukprot:Cvel_1859.t1-p1 / transcript=Cvel_1859.t1 / gene=Cvel_1859 / organism=Chromera_velia_CCMP2878 / gene_product=Eukaryotic peptide chain release factor subunit 1, putative / transcript_product=Eukaryotic peptide chain release factor subunit 1, putative / location=Cvel_scaffold69:26617-28665(+) / protein_length=452 / sequence_SO=supercontig / SO=protein_coding / is_pseudo=false
MSSTDSSQLQQQQQQLAEWKLQRLIKSLEEVRGGGTSVITLIVSCKDQLTRTSAKIAEELSVASNIKSRQRLKLYKKTPPNGLIILCGEVGDDTTSRGKERKLLVDFEPFKPVQRSFYVCNSAFHLDPLRELLTSHERYGFVVTEGNGCLIAEVQGNVKKTLFRLTASLPNKHRRGGQSALRFDRLRAESRLALVKKVAEAAGEVFLQKDATVSVKGLVVAGCGDLKNELKARLDPKLQNVIIKMVDTAYGGEAGLDQACDLAADALAGVRLVEERRAIGSLLEAATREDGAIRHAVFGTQEVTAALRLGACGRVIVWEGTELEAVTRRHAETGEEKVDIVAPRVAPVVQTERDGGGNGGGGGWEELQRVPLIEWLDREVAAKGGELTLVSDRTPEGLQLVRGLGGLGALLRFGVQAEVLESFEESKEDGGDGGQERETRGGEEGDDGDDFF